MVIKSFSKSSGGGCLVARLDTDVEGPSPPIEVSPSPPTRRYLVQYI